MKVLVTGATGFVGSHLCDVLHSQGHEIYALVRNSQKAQKLNLPGEYILGDLKQDSIKSWCKQIPADLDCVIHTAGIVSAKHSMTFALINQVATEELITQLGERYSKLHFMLISSQAAAGPSLSSSDLINEERDCTPVSAYGHSKLAAEQALKDNAPKEWKTTIIRPPMVIGPRDTAVLDIFKMVKGRVVTGPGFNFKKKSYSVVNVFDLVNAIILCATSETRANETYFVTSVDKVSFEELIKSISKSLGISRVFFLAIPIWALRLLAGIFYTFPIHLPLTSDKVNELAQSNWICSNFKIKELGFSPIYDLDSTIQMTTKDYQERKWL